jgi:NADH-quinone oxidoreductase subunit N
VGLLIVGFGFKVSSVPFHMWTPDVYEGAPTSVTAFMAVAVKTAAFAAFLRVFALGFMSLKWEWFPVLYWLAVLTMTYGNIAALAQKNIKRMLAYSSIAHAGYLLVGMGAIVRVPELGAGSVMYYLLVYTFMNLGAFGVVAYLAKKDEQEYDIEGYAGLAYRHPLAALALATFLFSLAGIPPLAGFIGKFYIFSAAIEARLYILAVIGVLNSALSVYYYIRVVYLMYAKEPVTAGPFATYSAVGGAAVLISAIAVVALGLFPSRLLDLAGHAAGMLMK